MTIVLTIFLTLYWTAQTIVLYKLYKRLKGVFVMERDERLLGFLFAIIPVIGILYALIGLTMDEWDDKKDWI